MDIETKNKFTFKSRVQSFGFALKGIAHAFKHERSIWLQALIALTVIIGGIFFKISNTEWVAIAFCIGMVFAMETMNTAIEHIVDFICPEYNKKAGIIKDLAAGAVLLSAFTTIVVALLVFAPKIIDLF